MLERRKIARPGGNLSGLSAAIPSIMMTTAARCSVQCPGIPVRNGLGARKPLGIAIVGGFCFPDDHLYTTP